MNAKELSEYLKPIVSTCPLWKDKKLCMELIANPAAGGFTQKKLSSEHEKVLSDYSMVAKTKEQQCKNLVVNLRRSWTRRLARRKRLSFSVLQKPIVPFCADWFL